MYFVSYKTTEFLYKINPLFFQYIYIGKRHLHLNTNIYGHESVISTLKLNGWPTNLVFSQLKEYPISLNYYKDIYP